MSEQAHTALNQYSGYFTLMRCPDGISVKVSYIMTKVCCEIDLRSSHCSVGANVIHTCLRSCNSSTSDDSFYIRKMCILLSQRLKPNLTLAIC